MSQRSPLWSAFLIFIPDTIPMECMVSSYTFHRIPGEFRRSQNWLEGRGLRDIAAVTWRSEGTVRWHLKQTFRKTGLSRQVEVVQRVLSLTGQPVSRG